MSFTALRAARDARHAPQRRVASSLSAGADEARTAERPDTQSAARSAPDPEDAALFPELSDTPLEVRQTANHGRGLYARQAISPGTTLLRTTPLSVLSTSHLLTHCSFCHAETKCQNADWSDHKPECAALTRLRKMWAATYPEKARRGENGFVPHEAIRGLGRLCWSRQRGKMGWAQVARMESHAGQSQDLGLGNQVNHLRHYLGAAEGEGDLLHPADMASFGFNSARELLDLASAFAVNSFTLSTPDLTPIGVSTSPLVALCNHSCWPNAVVVFPSGREMCVVAIADIAAGDEILTAYIDVSLPLAERQTDLHARYGFACDCSLCINGEDWPDPRWSVLHPGCGGIAPMPDLSLPDDAEVLCTCGQTFTTPIPSLRGLIEAGKRLLAADEDGELDRDAAISQLSTLVPALSARLPASAHPLLPLLRLYALQLTPPSREQRAFVIGLLSQAAAGARAAHPPNHPNVGVILAERAKIMAMDSGEERVMLDSAGLARRRGELVAAVSALREAAAACEVGFGGGEVAMSMRGLAAECEREVDMMR
ncbi:hypothetical protein CcaverHIS641_0410770 [Cutaneotrichosporon cavernicola]|nr:hypothetical protein CcaverHIS641_0410770 [Cutaneotrichosporon cavernicola]